MDEGTSTDDARPSGPVSRRSMLLSVAGAVVGTATLTAAARLGFASAALPDPIRRAPRHVRPIGAAEAELTSAPVIATGAPSFVAGTRARRPAPLPPWARRWNAPIYDLDDFLRRDRRSHYPARSVLLTIDDGPSAEWTPRYLRLLARHHVRATFNMIGEQVAPNRHLVRAVASEGHVIANHTWTHDEALPSGTLEHIHREIARTNEALHDLAGYVPTTFRAPGGVWGPRVFDELARLHMMPLGWDIDPRDWALPGVRAIESAMLAAGPGDIILCHDGGGDRSETYAALETVIPALLRRGLHFVTLPT